MRKTLGLILAGALALSLNSCAKISLEKVEDLTGDGKPDVLLNIKVNALRDDNLDGKHLFIYKEGKYIHASGRSLGDSTYFVTDDGKTAYFFDGKFYRESPIKK